MRSALTHHLKLSDNDLTKLWSQGTFVFDASALLGVYECSATLQKAFTAFVTKTSERIFVPHQFALEYIRNRNSVLHKQASFCAAAKSALEDVEKRYFQPKRAHPHISDQAAQAFQQLKAELMGHWERLDKLVGSDPEDEILSAFEGHVGPQLAAADFSKLCDMGRDRYKRSEPPGYSDLQTKGEPDAFGDYIGWSQMIARSKSDQRGMIFIIDDVKEDWWVLKRKNNPISARPELREEFHRDTGGQLIHFYTSARFFREAARFLVPNPFEVSLEEIEQLTEDVDEGMMLDAKIDEVDPKTGASRASPPASKEALKRGAASDQKAR